MPILRAGISCKSSWGLMNLPIFLKANSGYSSSVKNSELHGVLSEHSRRVRVYINMYVY